MKTRTIEQKIKAYYREQSLDENKLGQLAAQAALADRGGAALRRRWSYGALAATVILGLALSMFSWDFRRESDWVLRASHEVALNHQKQLETEFSATDFATLRTQMGKLDFVLTAPARLSSADLHVVGARYCSIQGHLAAQVKLADGKGRRYTLYQTQGTYANDLGEMRTTVNSVDILLWNEAGSLFALATSTE